MLKNINTAELFKKLELEKWPQPEYIQLQHPVVLCHGYGAIASLIKPTPLQDVCMLLRQHGLPAFAPNIVPYAKIEIRAHAWKRLILELLDTLETDKVNIVAHSMGGLDMRYAISKLGISEHIESLTTVATPHQGATLARFALDTPRPIKNNLASVFNWMGNQLYPEIESDSEGSVKQLTPEYVQKTFNPEVPDMESVDYYSVSAAVGKGTNAPVENLVNWQNNYIYEHEGINDGFVSERSAHWGTHLKMINLSHLEQMRVNLDKKQEQFWKKFWTDLMKDLSTRGH